MIDFPNAPTNGQTFSASGQSWTWDGEKWVASTGAAASSVQSVAGKTGVVTLVHTDITDWSANVPAPYVLPAATPSALGGVKPDGTTITVASGVISASAGLTDAPNNGVAYARKNLGWATLTHNDITDWSANVPAPYVLPSATTTTLGGVKPDGTTVTVAAGVLSAVSGYTLPQATTSVLGGVKVDGTTITAASGVISSSGVQTFNTRNGAVTLVSGDVTAALGFTPYNTTNPSGYQTAAQVTASLGAYLPLAGGALSGGVSFGSVVAPGGLLDLSRHLALYSTTYGLNVTGSSLNVVSQGANAASFGPTSSAINGNLSVNSATGSCIINLSKNASGSLCMLQSFTGAAVAANLRWGVALGSTSAEGGGNAGSNFSISNYSDTGAALGTPVSIVRSTGAVNIFGTSTNDSAAAGYVGEVISSNVTTGVTLTTATAANVTSISLTAGDWDVSGEVWIAVGAGGATGIAGSINTTSATLSGSSSFNQSRFSLTAAFTASINEIFPLRAARVSLAATTTYYLIAQATFPSGATTATGNIIARRMR